MQQRRLGTLGITGSPNGGGSSGGGNSSSNGDGSNGSNGGGGGGDGKPWWPVYDIDAVANLLVDTAGGGVGRRPNRHVQSIPKNPRAPVSRSRSNDTPAAVKLVLGVEVEGDAQCFRTRFQDLLLPSTFCLPSPSGAGLHSRGRSCAVLSASVPPFIIYPIKDVFLFTAVEGFFVVRKMIYELTS